MKKVICFIIALLTMPFVAQGETPNSAVQQTKIVTNCPYLKVSIVKCVANGKTVILEMKMTNMSGNDANDVSLYCVRDVIQAYDDQGNIYENGAVALKFANKEFVSSSGARYDFLADVPVRVTVRFEGVSTIAEALARVTIRFQDHDVLGLKYSTPITLRNIPITRQ